MKYTNQLDRLPVELIYYIQDIIDSDYKYQHTQKMLKTLCVIRKIKLWQDGPVGCARYFDWRYCNPKRIRLNNFIIALQIKYWGYFRWGGFYNFKHPLNFKPTF